MMKNVHISTVLSNYAGKKTLITGATGFIGQHLLKAVSSTTSDIAIITSKHNAGLNVHRQYIGSMLDSQFVNNSILNWRPEIIFHLAGARLPGGGRDVFLENFDVNLVGTLNLLFAAGNLSDLKRIVIMGTAEEYGMNMTPFNEKLRENPVSPYSLSKLCASHLAQLMHRNMELPVVVLRPSVVYGPAQRYEMFLPALINALIRGNKFQMTAGSQTRDYIYVADVVDAILRAGTSNGVNGAIINIASGEPILISKLVTMVESMFDKSDLVERGALNYRVGEPMEYWLDIAEARQMLDWKPFTSLESGLMRTVAWYRDSIT